MNFIIYPEARYDTPIFLFFCLLTGRRLICHVNVNCMRDDEAHRARWVAPLLEARKRHWGVAVPGRSFEVVGPRKGRERTSRRSFVQ